MISMMNSENNSSNESYYDGKIYQTPPEDELCPKIFESDNPIYDLEKNGDAVAACAKGVFGIPALYPWQRLAISNILDAVSAVEALDKANSDEDSNDDSVDDSVLYDEDGALRGQQIILLPTGAGKSLCFQVPALLMDGVTVVIYPLLALMSDQFRRMQEGGLEPVIFRGGQSPEEREKQFARMEGTDGKPPAKLIIANPEVLAGEKLLNRISACKVSHLAIDEAHCVSEWGDSFRPAYLELNAIIKALKPSAVTAFTATASPPVLERIAEILFDGKAHLVRGESDRPNIVYAVKRCRIKEPALLEEVKKRAKPMVIFCASRKGTERTAAFLRYSLNTENIRFYHAGLERDEKAETEKWFHSNKSGILVTTCAWGMGVDKKDIKTVIHRDFSQNAEAYVQEAGRGGRDGSVSEAVLLWTPSDKETIKTLPAKQRLRAKIIEDFAESGRCRRQILLAALGEERAIAKSPDEEEIACSGCDICDGNAIQYNEDEKMLLDFIKRNNRAYTQAELVSIFSEELENWRASDVKALCAELLEAKMIKKSNALFWKDRIQLN